MKSLVLLVFSACFVMISTEWTVRTREEMFKDRDECFESGKVPEPLQEKIKNLEYPDEPEVRCYLRCILLKGGIWDDTKGYNVTRGHAELGNAGMQGNIEDMRKCAKENTDNLDTCRWAASIVKCFADNKYIKEVGSVS